MTFSHGGIKKHVLRDFPGVTQIDLKRIPSIPSLTKMMVTEDFKDVHYHVAKQDEGYVSTDEYLERVRNRYISTLTLLTEEQFQKGLRTFQEKIRKKYGDRIRRISRFIFIAGKK